MRRKSKTLSANELASMHERKIRKQGDQREMLEDLQKLVNTQKWGLKKNVDPYAPPSSYEEARAKGMMDLERYSRFPRLKRLLRRK